MASKAYESGKKYYPEYWEIERLIKLTEAGKLTEEEYKELTGFDYPNVE